MRAKRNSEVLAIDSWKKTEVPFAFNYVHIILLQKCIEFGGGSESGAMDECQKEGGSQQKIF